MLKALFLAASIFLCASMARAQSYTITDLGSFGGLNGSIAMAVNDGGKATGWASRGSATYSPHFCGRKAKACSPWGRWAGVRDPGSALTPRVRLWDGPP